jgi:hypothetical protein
MLVMVDDTSFFYKLKSNLTDWERVFNPFPPGAHLWLDPADSNVTSVSGGLVDSVTDKGLSGSVLSGSGATRFSVGTLGGKQALYIDSTAKRMKIENKTLDDIFTLAGAAGPQQMAGSFTLFVVVKPQSVLVAESWSFFYEDTDTNTIFFFLEDAGAGNMNFGLVSFARSYPKSVVPNDASAHVYCIRFFYDPGSSNDRNISHWVDGVKVLDTFPTGHQGLPGSNTHKWGMGGAGNTGKLLHYPDNVRDALLGDVLLYGAATHDSLDNSGKLSDAQILSVSQALMSKWGIT